MTFPCSIGLAHVTTALPVCCRPKQIFMNRQTLLSCFHFDMITHCQVRHEKLLEQTAFFKATLKELWQRVS